MTLPNLLSKDTITVEAPAATLDASGGFVASPWTMFATGVPARVEPLGAFSGVREFYATQGAVVSHMVYTQLDGIRQGMRITTSDGVQLVVQDVQKQRQLGRIPTYYEVVCQQIQV